MENVDFSRAYDYIRERILNGEFPTGHPLKADILAVQIGVSRTPVRDALRELSADGLVSILPRIGASVRSIGLQEFSDMCELRMALEIFAAGKAARLRTGSDLKEMASAKDAVKAEAERLIAAASESQSYSGTISSALLDREDIRFHIAITSAAKNELIKEEILRQQLIDRIISSPRHVGQDHFVPGNQAEEIALLRATLAEHQEIYEKISGQDDLAARGAMEMHLREDLGAVLRRMARFNSGLIAGELSRTGSESGLKHP